MQLHDELRTLMGSIDPIFPEAPAASSKDPIDELAERLEAQRVDSMLLAMMEETLFAVDGLEEMTAPPSAAMPRKSARTKKPGTVPSSVGAKKPLKSRTKSRSEAPAGVKEHEAKDHISPEAEAIMDELGWQLTSHRQEPCGDRQPIVATRRYDRFGAGGIGAISRNVALQKAGPRASIASTQGYGAPGRYAAAAFHGGRKGAGSNTSGDLNRHR
ncbi:hypothetical protein PSQ19_05650 [Devosia algicola]|uniref:Uncharacterized protein n=1 Tax=Devosia algicola TaxID=3026418 RepID=A0ABY7YQN9_9HYPH|nr:hypothetical protein [Devosia algicola]WDR03571.1 hypothetical protein PSQ19_05650 [Devosia algicola]